MATKAMSKERDRNKGKQAATVPEPVAQAGNGLAQTALSQPPTQTRCAITIVNDSEQLTIPPWVVDLESFRRWTDMEEVPEKERIWYLKGEIWIDMSKEQLFSHNQVKVEVTIVLGGLDKTGKLGRFFTDGLRVTNVQADISGLPDATFVSTKSLETGQVRLIEGKAGGYTELEGTPDMILEVISRSSVRKDNVVLREAYYTAGIPEFWLVDARREPLQFDILRHTAKGYVATRKQGGWLRSAVFGKAFQLTQQTGADGYPEFTLAVR
jgi:Uma2 family endonuclease